ncbi:hypothetical protein BVI434_2030007 [Burkholderia vietnamiensis]|nr:hypothetical protein BVI434_2030007 [Burkholderia vietnamiensis]
MRDGKIGQNDRYYNIRGGTGKIAGVRTALPMKKPARGELLHLLTERTGLAYILQAAAARARANPSRPAESRAGGFLRPAATCPHAGPRRKRK